MAKLLELCDKKNLVQFSFKRSKQQSSHSKQSHSEIQISSAGKNCTVIIKQVFVLQETPLQFENQAANTKEGSIVGLIAPKTVLFRNRQISAAGKICTFIINQVFVLQEAPLQFENEAANTKEGSIVGLSPDALLPQVIQPVK